MKLSDDILQFLGLIIGATLFVILLICKIDTLLSTIVGLAATLVVDRISQGILNQRRHDELKERLDFAINRIEKGQFVFPVGRSDQTHEEMEKSIETSHSVRNTFISDPDYFSPIKFERDASLLYNGLLQRSESDTNRWIDIINNGAKNLERFKLIKPIHIGQYQVKCLDISMALPCFLICEGDEKTVFFGWIYKGDRYSDIFRSSDPRIIETFENYWSILWRVSENVSPVDLGVEVQTPSKTPSPPAIR